MPVEVPKDLKLAPLKPFDGNLDGEVAAFDGLLDSEKSGTLRRAADVGISTLKGAIGVPEAAVGIADIATGGKVGKAAESFGFRPKEAKAFLDEQLSAEQKLANRKVSEAKGFLPTVWAAVQNPSTILHSAVESLPVMGAGGVIARPLVGSLRAAGVSEASAPMLAAAAGEGVAGAGSAAEQIRQETPGGLLDEKQTTAAAASGLGTMVLGAAGGKIAQKLKVSDIDTMIASGKLAAPAGGTTGFVRRLVKGGISEGVFEELPQSAQEQMWQNYATGKPIMEGVPEAAAMGMVVGAAMGGTVNAVAGPHAGAETPAPAPGGPISQAATVARASGAAPAAQGPLGGATGAPPEASAKPLFGFTADGAQKRAEFLGRQGEPHRVIPHPERDQRFAVIPDTYGTAPDDEGRIQGLRDEAEAIISRVPKGKPLTSGVAGRMREIDEEIAKLDKSVAKRKEEEAKAQFKADAAAGRAEGAAAAEASKRELESARSQTESIPYRDRRAEVLPALPAPERTGFNVDSQGNARPAYKGDTVDAGAHAAATSPQNDRSEPSDKQKAAGNYLKGHVPIGPFEVSVENPSGSKRRAEWPTLKAHYGYFKGVPARAPDKEHVDTFVKEGTKRDHAGQAFVVDQNHANGKFDEPKVMVGYATRAEAIAAYLENYEPGWEKRVRGVADLTTAQLQERLNDQWAFMKPQPDATPLLASQPASPQGDGAAAVAPKPADAVKSMQQETEAALKRQKGPEILRTISSAREDTAKQAEAASKAQAEPKTPKARKERASAQRRAIGPLSDPEIREVIHGMRLEVGHEDRGGRLIVDQEGAGRAPGMGDVTGKVPWTGHAWWFERPDKVTAKHALRIIDKALAGDRLGKREQSFLDYMVDEARFRLTGMTPRDLAELTAQQRDQALAAADKAVSAVQDWAILTDDERKALHDEAVLDEIFGPESAGLPASAAEGAGSRAENGAGEARPAGGGEGEVKPPPAETAATTAPSKEGVSASELALREQAHATEAAGDVLLMTGQFVSFDAAVSAVKAGIESGEVRAVPAQLHFKLDLAMRDVDRVLAAAQAPALKLTGQTEAEITAERSKQEAQAKRKADEEATAEAKAKADAAREQYTLTGSDRPADQAAAKWQTGLFSRGTPPVEGDLASTALTMLAKHDDLFRYAVSDKPSLEAIAAEVSPRLKVSPITRGSLDRIAESGWFIEDDQKNTAEVFEKSGEVWVNIADWQNGQGGSEIYAIVSNFAHAAGKVFVGDPNGLSSDATFRRTELMLSMALKFGTTKFMRPAKEQIEGKYGASPMKWTPGDDAFNLRQLIETSYANSVNQAPEIAHVRYNFETRQYERGGRQVDGSAFDVIAGRARHRGRLRRRSLPDFPTADDRRGEGTEAIGRTTLERAVLQNTLLRAGSGAGRARILGEILRQSREGLDPALKRSFYSRPAPERGLSVSTVDSVTHEIEARIGKLESSQLRIVQAWRALPANAVARVEAEGATDIQGWFDAATQTVWIVADNVAPGRAFAVLMHEAGVHLGMDAEVVGKLANRVRLWSHAKSDTEHTKLARLAIARIPPGTPADEADQELVAYFVEEAVRAGHDAAKPDDIGPLAQWFRDLWAAVKAALAKLDLRPESLTTEDVVAIARGSLERALAGGDPDPIGRGMASQRPPTFYSALTRSVAAMKTGRAPPAQWKATIKSLTGIKADEVEWSGVNEWLDLQQGLVTKQAIMDYLRENGVRVEETMLGGKGNTKGDILHDEIVRLTALGFDPWMRQDGMIGGVTRRSSGEVFPDDDEPFWSREIPLDVQNLVTNIGALQEAQSTSEAIDDPAVTRFDTWQLPGGQNYRELLLRLPSKDSLSENTQERARQLADEDGENWNDLGPNARQRLYTRAADQLFTGAGNFRSGHFEQPNILAHIRFNERTDADGKRVLFLEEIQSDWAQKGKREGFRLPKMVMAPGEPSRFTVTTDEHQYHVTDPRSGRRVDIGRGTVGSEQEARDYAERYFERGYAEAAKREERGIPRGPFVGKTEAWVGLALKRMIRYAAENGFERVAWTTGEQQAERYDLSKQIEELHVYRHEDGLYDLSALTAGARRLHDLASRIPGAKLADYVGKDLAARIERGEGEPDKGAGRWRKFSGIDLKVGGEGMLAFYDKIVPNVANDVLKKLSGGRVGVVTMPSQLTRQEAARRVYGEGYDTLPAESQARVRGVEQQNMLTQPGFDITPKIAQSAMGGQALFSRAGSLSDEDRSRLTASAETTEAAGAQSARARVLDRVKSLATAGELGQDEGVLNAWNKTVGTPELVARKNPAFAKVFWEGQQYLTDVNAFISESESMLPTWFKGQDVLSRWFDRVRGHEVAKAELAAKALLDGTLANRVYTDAELRAQGLAPREIAMYDEARTAVDAILEKTGTALITKISPAYAKVAGRLISIYRDSGMAGLEEFAQYSERVGKASVKGLERDLEQATTDEARKSLNAVLKAEQARLEEWQIVSKSAERIVTLQRQGYFPLSRFGRHYVNVTDPRGETVEFRMYEGDILARAGAAQLSQKYPKSYQVVRGTISQDTPELFRGLTPESVELFADITGMNEDPAMQKYLKEAVANRSMLKRMIHRKGTPGYSKDAVRVLADFISANARYNSRLQHFDAMTRYAHDIKGGELRDYAINLVKYLRGDDSREEYQSLRGFLFFQYIGGNISSALLNLSQVPVFGAPWLNQHVSVPQVGRILKRAYTLAARGPEKIMGELGQALARAEKEGITNPQNVYTTMAIGSGSRLARIRAFSGLLDAWAFLFSRAETLNRRVMFIAGYDVAKSRGLSGNEAFDFAAGAVRDTQFIYNKGNRPVWARGIGAIPFTFKLFTVQALETIVSRLPPKQAAMVLALLLLAAGAEGLPFGEDVEDAIDIVGQKLGYATNSKLWLAQSLNTAFRDWMGLPADTAHAAAEMVRKGVFANTSIASLGRRIGMGNILPGLDALKTGQNLEGKALDAGGPAVGLARSAWEASELLARGEVERAAEKLLPSGISNFLKGYRQLESGEEVTPFGRRVSKVPGQEALMQTLGVSAATPARQREVEQIVKQDESYLKVVEDRIADKWASGIVSKDQAKVQEARDELKAHNERNPDAKIRITPQQIQSRVKNLRQDGAAGLIKGVAKERRGPARELVREFAQ